MAKSEEERREAARARGRRHYAKNREKRARYSRERRINHPEKVREADKRYAEKNRDKTRLQKRERYSEKVGDADRRAACSHCGVPYKIRQDGVLRKHLLVDRTPCPGGGVLT